MRVIAGIYGGRRLRSLEGLAVRPTSDRLRETLFNILGSRIAGTRFLDLCAGSGAVGIEALSRGAGHVTFIERSRRACSVIRQNLRTLEAEAHATIFNRDAITALRRLTTDSRVFELVFVDPPYESQAYSEIMAALGKGLILTEGALVVVEHRAKTPPQSEVGRLREYRVIKQGESALAFYELV
ncbi:MAG TPA: 16S rRNA (guanine(966)-N(2))-methyltransferase RsmD [Blastocatellia bacterium]|nr:16S rRNA (guanine(966)-N(2))-methyltransferase RsmD [Blastocatellia bacterium]